jgi:hypothetical protein
MSFLTVPPGAAQQLGVPLRGKVNILVCGLGLGAVEQAREEILVAQGLDQQIGQAAVAASGGQPTSVQLAGKTDAELHHRLPKIA